METVVSVQSDMEDVLVELPDGKRGLLLRSRSRCEHQAVQTQWPSMLSQDFERSRAVLLKPRQFARSLRSNVVHSSSTSTCVRCAPVSTFSVSVLVTRNEKSLKRSALRNLVSFNPFPQLGNSILVVLRFVLRYFSKQRASTSGPPCAGSWPSRRISGEVDLPERPCVAHPRPHQKLRQDASGQIGCRSANDFPP